MVVFWRPEVQVGEAVAFQLSLSAPSDVSIFALPVTSLKIHFMDGLGQLSIAHQAASEELASHHIQLIDVGHVHLGGEAPNEVRADLRWTTRSKVVFSGTVILEKPGTIKVSMKTCRVLIILKRDFDRYPVLCWACRRMAGISRFHSTPLAYAKARYWCPSGCGPWSPFNTSQSTERAVHP